MAKTKTKATTSLSMADRDGWIWHDGKLVPWRSATTHVLTHSLHYGLAVFEGVRAYKTVSGTQIFRLREHAQRLINSGHIYMMKIPYTIERLMQAHLEVVAANGHVITFVRGTNNNLWMVDPQGAGWTNVGSGLAGNPSAVLNPNTDRVNVYIRDTGNNLRMYDPAVGWSTVGSGLGGDPSTLVPPPLPILNSSGFVPVRPMLQPLRPVAPTPLGGAESRLNGPALANVNVPPDGSVSKFWAYVPPV